jgi:hypothetical protein
MAYSLFPIWVFSNYSFEFCWNFVNLILALVEPAWCSIVSGYGISSVADPGSGAFYSLDPGWIFSGSRIQMLCFLVRYSEIILRILVILFFTNICSWSHKEQEKFLIYFPSLFLCTVVSGWKLRFRHVKFRDPDPG